MQTLKKCPRGVRKSYRHGNAPGDPAVLQFFLGGTNNGRASVVYAAFGNFGKRERVLRLC